MIPGHAPSAPIKRIDLNLSHRFHRAVGLWLAPRCPGWLAPEAIACSGFVFALVVGAAFLLASQARGWLWVALAGMALQQLSDCLDGAVARHRGRVSEHGMFLDIFIDNLSFTVMFLALASADYTQFPLIAIALMVYLLNDTVVNLRILFQRTHLVTAISPVEICAVAGAGCVLTFFWPGSPLTVWGYALGWFDLIAVAAIGYGTVELLTAARRLYLELLREGR